ncbi:MAG: hypothetical protein HQL95_12200 [Magnetococcales bacterium]|nr:hypothetical protein [Magnetococcales bacterium]
MAILLVGQQIIIHGISFGASAAACQYLYPGNSPTESLKNIVSSFKNPLAMIPLRDSPVLIVESVTDFHEKMTQNIAHIKNHMFSKLLAGSVMDTWGLLNSAKRSVVLFLVLTFPVWFLVVVYYGCHQSVQRILIVSVAFFLIWGVPWSLAVYSNRAGNKVYYPEVRCKREVATVLHRLRLSPAELAFLEEREIATLYFHSGVMRNNMRRFQDVRLGNSETPPETWKILSLQKQPYGILIPFEQLKETRRASRSGEVIIQEHYRAPVETFTAWKQLPADESGFCDVPVAPIVELRAYRKDQQEPGIFLYADR